MITRDNFSQVCNEITEDQVNKVKEVWEEYILLEVTYSNACHWITFESVPYSEEIETEANDNGQLFCDFDSFMIAFEESDSVNPFLIELM